MTSATASRSNSKPGHLLNLFRHRSGTSPRAAAINVSSRIEARTYRDCGNAKIRDPDGYRIELIGG
jgi:hypothetical protein